jgi:hypothetical protein
MGFAPSAVTGKTGNALLIDGAIVPTDAAHNKRREGRP